VRTGFSLIELVVVVLIVGIVAAIAAPRMLDATGDARESSLLHSLSVVRDAIELYRAHQGSFPGEMGTEADFKTDLKPYLRKFPANPLKNSAVVAVKTDGTPFTGTLNGGIGWQYDNASGQFIANSGGMSSDGVKRYWEL
jgi:general secretion pathway protein G